MMFLDIAPMLSIPFYEKLTFGLHFKMMICDENNDFGHMPCICNEYTRGPPGTGPVVPIGGEDPIEDRVDPIPEVDPVDPGIPLNTTDPTDPADYVVPEIAVIPAHLKCKRYDPGSNWFLGELNPFDDPTLDPKPVSAWIVVGIL